MARTESIASWGRSQRGRAAPAGSVLRWFLGLFVVALVGATCSSGGAGTLSTTIPPTLGTAGSAAPTTTTATAPVTSATPPAPPVTEPGAASVLAELTERLDAGEVDAALALLGPNAAWMIEPGLTIRLDDELPSELAWLSAAFGLNPGASGGDVLRREWALRATLGTRFRLTACRHSGATAECDFESEDALSNVSGIRRRGSVGIGVESGRIVRLEMVAADDVGDPAGDADAFRRWAAVEEPYAGIDPADLESIALFAALPDRWQEAGRPDLATPGVPGGDPVEVIQAYLDARQTGDWAGHMSLLGGAALGQAFGSREEFDAAVVLERRIRVGDCEVTLESDRVGSIVACSVVVSDIVTEAAGIDATNPNKTTFQVRDGRVTSLPEFIPSLFIAETAIEDWSLAVHGDDYLAACPEGIAGQRPYEGLACARFVAAHRADWGPFVAAGY